MSGNMERPLPASLAAFAQSAYRIELSLNVTDAAALWQAAFDKGLSSLAASRDDLVEMIGPAEDPDLGACLTLLTLPSAIPGCALEDFDLVEQRAAAEPRAANDLVAQRVGASA